MMNDYERKQAEELAVTRYPYNTRRHAQARLAYVQGYGDALDSVAGDFLEEVDAELAEDLKLDPEPWVYKGERRASYVITLGWEAVFKPREGYSQNRGDYHD